MNDTAKRQSRLTITSYVCVSVMNMATGRRTTMQKVGLLAPEEPVTSPPAAIWRPPYQSPNTSTLCQNRSKRHTNTVANSRSMSSNVIQNAPGSPGDAQHAGGKGKEDTTAHDHDCHQCCPTWVLWVILQLLSHLVCPAL